MSNEDNAKGGVLSGGALTEEVIESSESVLQQQGANTKGLQQFFSPPEMAALVATLYDRQAVLDLTAGDGSLLAGVSEGMRYGVEIDADQIANARTAGNEYVAVHGDVQQVAPILVDVDAKWDAVALNPPYGLLWEDPTINEGKPTNSAIVAFEYGARLLGHRGQMLMLSGGSSKFENIGDKLTYHHQSMGRTLVPYAVLHVPDMFENVQSQTDVTLFGWIYASSGTPDVLHLDVHREDLATPETLEKLRTARQATDYRAWGMTSQNEIHLWMRAAQQEHDRRRGEKPKRKSDFDVYGEKKRIRVALRPYTSLKLAGGRAYHHLKSFDRQPLEYFVLNHKAWEGLLTMVEQETITIEPALIERVRKLINERDRDIVPMYELKVQQRLAYLEDLDKILCTTGDPDKGFVEAEEYPISVQTVIQQTRERGRPVVNQKTGDITLKDFLQERKVLQIRIKGKTFTESKQDIEYIVEHFAVPDPGTVADRYPEETEAMRQLLAGFEANQSWDFKPFQKEDLARLLVKGSGLLAWEQGLGKTLAGLTFAKGCVEAHGAADKVLIVVPQDLIPQWRREAKRFYGVELRWLKSAKDFVECKRHLRAGGTGWYITHYEALSRAGKIDQKAEIGTIKVRGKIEEQTTGGDYYHDDDGKLRRTPIETQMVRTVITDATNCPRCGTSYRNGYNPQGVCMGNLPKSNTKCGWTRHTKRVKPQSDFVKSVFRHGVLVIDELTKMKGESERSRAVRGIKAAHTLGMTGTPIKNYIPDSFWGLWKSLGDASPRFPYAYHGGKTKYENDFAVIEYQLGGGWRRENRKVLPEVTNVSRLWRLLSASIIRRRKEETGEDLVKRTFYPTHVPLGVKQRAAAERWLQSFGTFFALKNPDHPVVQKGMHEVMAAMLGQLWKLEFAATLPQADPDADFWVKGGELETLCEEQGKPVPTQWQIEPVSNWTPANVRVLELAMHHASKGDRVLIGSDIVLPGEWLKEQLETRGVKVGNVLTGGDGAPPKTKSPAARAKIVQEFQDGKIDVLIATCEALNLGHNLDKGTVAIINGLPWDFATFDQFIARIHRLTSERDVKVYVIVPRGTLSERKWKLLVDKGAAAMLALDGRLIEQDEEHIDQTTILKQLIEAGVPVNGTEVEEDELERRWLEIKSAADLGDIVLEGVGVEDLHELTEAEAEEVDAEVTEQPDPDAQIEPESDDLDEVEEEVEGDEDDGPEHAFCRQCDTELYGNAYLKDGDGDSYCSYDCAKIDWSDKDLVELFNVHVPADEADAAELDAAEEPDVADATSDSESSPEPVSAITPDPNAYDYPIGPLTKPFEAAQALPEPSTITPAEAAAIIAAEEQAKIAAETHKPEPAVIDEVVTEMPTGEQPTTTPTPAPAGGLGLF